MTDPQRLHELIQADLDGLLDGADKAELAALLLSDPEARRLHEAFRRTDTLLRDIPQAPPPDGLRSAVLEALGLADHSRGGRRVADGGVGFRLAAAVVAGLVIVGLGYGLLSERRDAGNLQGSLAAGAARTATLQAGQGEVQARVTATNGRSRLVLETRGAASGELALSFDPERVACRSVGGAPGLSSPGDGQWILALSGGGSAALDCQGEGSLRLESRSGETLMDGATLTLPP